MESSVVTELRLGLSGRDEVEVKSSNKRSCSEMDDRSESVAPPTKAQLVGWPPVRSYRKNVQQKKPEADGSSAMYVKVSMDGVPYLRKIDLKFYKNYFDLLKALEKMLKCSIGCEYAAIYEDKDGDWMLAGDVPWDMFLTSCKRLRIIKASQTKAL